MTKTICLDFDGVIHSYRSGWQGADVIPDPPVPGVIEWMAAIVGSEVFEEHRGSLPNPLNPFSPREPYVKRHVFDICVYSSRSHQEGGIEAMKAWLLAHASMLLGPKRGMALLKAIKWPQEKPPAHITIDDRALCFQGPDSLPTAAQIAEFRPWNKR